MLRKKTPTRKRKAVGQGAPATLDPDWTKNEEYERDIRDLVGVIQRVGRRQRFDRNNLLAALKNALGAFGMVCTVSKKKTQLRDGSRVRLLHSIALKNAYPDLVAKVAFKCPHCDHCQWKKWDL